MKLKHCLLELDGMRRHFRAVLDEVESKMSTRAFNQDNLNGAWIAYKAVLSEIDLVERQWKDGDPAYRVTEEMLEREAETAEQDQANETQTEGANAS